MGIDLRQSERIRTGFSEWAPTYDQDTRGEMQWAAPRQLTAMLRPHLRAGDRVLDLGCGTGQSPQHLAYLRLEWTGVDLCLPMLAQARATGAYREVRRMNVERRRYPFSPQSFDAVLAAGVFEFTAHLGRILKELRRLLVDQGVVAFSVELPPSEADADVLDSDEFYYLRYRYGTALVEKYLDEAKLSLRKMERIQAYLLDAETSVSYACFLASRD